MKPHELRRQAKREHNRKMRLTDPSYGRKSEPEWRIRHEAKDGTERASGIIYSCTATLIK